MSLKTILISSLLAATAIATDYGSGSGGWSGWEGKDGPPAFAAASCPAGCIPIPTGGAPPPPAPTGAGELIVQVVSVADANGSLKYFPDKIDAPVGSIVQFQFHPKNHTITESSFAEPCKPLAANLTSETRPGVKSGFVPVTGTEDFTPVYNVLINDTKPIWIYCGQTNHCQRGMAMVINQNSTSPNTIEKYIENAGKIDLVSTPPPAGTQAPPPPPVQPPAESPTFGFGGGDQPPPPPPPEESSSFVPAPAVETFAPSSSVPIAPATFTGAAVPGFMAPRSSTSVVGLVLGALLALW